MSDSSSEEDSSGSGTERYVILELYPNRLAHIACREWLIKPKDDGILMYWDPGATSDSQHKDAARNKVAPRTGSIQLDDGGGAKRIVKFNWTKLQYSKIIAQSDSFRRIVDLWSKCSESSDDSENELCSTNDSENESRSTKNNKKSFKLKDVRPETRTPGRVDSAGIKEKLMGIGRRTSGKNEFVKYKTKARSSVDKRTDRFSKENETIVEEKTNDTNDVEEKTNDGQGIMTDDPIDVYSSTQNKTSDGASPSPHVLPTVVRSTMNATVQPTTVGSAIAKLSQRFTRVELSLATILKKLIEIEKRLDASHSTSTVQEAVAELRGLFPIRTEHGFNDFESKLDDAEFRNKFCKFLGRFDATFDAAEDKGRQLKKKEVENILQCVFDKSVTEFGTWSGARKDEESQQRRAKMCISFKDTVVFDMIRDRATTIVGSNVIADEVIKEWIRNKCCTRKRNLAPDTNSGKPIRKRNSAPDTNSGKRRACTTPTSSRVDNTSEGLLRRSPRLASSSGTHTSPSSSRQPPQTFVRTIFPNEESLLT